MWSLKNTQYCYITELRGQFSIALSVDFLLFYCAHHSPKCWHAVMGHRLCRQTCLAPEEFKNSRSGPWPKKVVHHCRTGSELGLPAPTFQIVPTTLRTHPMCRCLYHT